MTNKELQEKITRLEAKLVEVKEKMEAMIKRTDGGGAFKPEYGQEYWSILASGEVYEIWWENRLGDHNRYAIGNCYPTEQAAEDAVRVLKLTQKARESQDGFVPDWEDTTQYKYFLDCHMGDIGVANHPSIHVAPIFGFWEDKSACEQFIDENNDELRWFFTEYRR